MLLNSAFISPYSGGNAILKALTVGVANKDISRMALPRILLRKWSKSWRTGRTFFIDFQRNSTVLQKKIHSCDQYTKLASHQKKYVSLFPLEYKQLEPSSIFKNVRKCSSSALYINRTEVNRTPVVNVDLSLMERLHDVTELQENLSARKKEMNVLQLAEDFKSLMKLELEKNELEEKRKNISDMMAALSKVKDADDNIKRSREILKPKGRELKEMLRALNKELNELENNLIPRCLRLPNILHKDTPLNGPVILQESISPNVSPVADEENNHIKIGQKLNWLKFSDVGPGAFYLTGKLAWLEQNWIYQISQNLSESGFLQLSCPEIFRTLVVEGCGVDYNSSDKIHTLQNTDVETDEKVEHLSHFVGVSYMSFAAYLTRMELKSENLPLRYFTVGKSYRPASPSFPDVGLYEAAQTTKCEACCACVDQTQAEFEFQELVKILCDWYSTLGLPFRLVLVPAADLQFSEMKKMVIEIWAPSLQRYLQVGYVSNSGIYISQRLMISHSGISSGSKPVSLVHAEFLDMSKLFALLMEYEKISNEQSQFQLPVLAGRNIC